MEALPYISLALTLACAAFAIASVFSQKAAAILRQPTRLRGFGAWLGLGFLCLVMIGTTAPNPARYAELPGKIQPGAPMLPPDTKPAKSLTQVPEAAAGVQALMQPAQGAPVQEKGAVAPVERKSKNGRASRPKQEGQRLASSAMYSGNVKSFKFHNQFCGHFHCRDCVRSFNSRDEALAAGFAPCKRCGG